MISLYWEMVMKEFFFLISIYMLQIRIWMAHQASEVIAAYRYDQPNIIVFFIVGEILFPSAAIG